MILPWPVSKKCTTCRVRSMIYMSEHWPPISGPMEASSRLTCPRIGSGPVFMLGFGHKLGSWEREAYQGGIAWLWCYGIQLLALAILHVFKNPAIEEFRKLCVPRLPEKSPSPIPHLTDVYPQNSEKVLRIVFTLRFRIVSTTESLGFKDIEFRCFTPPDACPITCLGQ